MPREGAGLGQVRREAMPEPSLDSSSSALPTGLRQAADELADSFFFFFATEAHPQSFQVAPGTGE